MSSEKRPLTLYLLMAAVLFQGASGLVGGVGLVSDPSGAGIGLPTAMLADSAFDTFLIPGVVLLVVLGIFPLFVMFALWQGYRWSWYGAHAVGSALTIWIAVQIGMVGYYPSPPLQLIYGLLGVLIVGLSLQPSVRQSLKPSHQS